MKPFMVSEVILHRSRTPLVPPDAVISQHPDLLSVGVFLVEDVAHLKWQLPQILKL